MDKIKFTKLENLPIEEVVWEDHFSTDSWTTVEDKDLEGSILVTTVGYRIRETKTKIIISMNITTNNHVSGTMTILKKTVKSRRVIQEAK